MFDWFRFELLGNVLLAVLLLKYIYIFYTCTEARHDAKETER